MSASEIDLKFLSLFASNLSHDQPLLSTSLYQILGNLTLLSPLVLRARKLRRLDQSRSTPSLTLYSTIIWYSREGLRILEGIVLPMVSAFGELKVLAYKLRAGYVHLWVLFGNVPQISLARRDDERAREMDEERGRTENQEIVTPPGLAGRGDRSRVDKGKGISHVHSPTPSPALSSTEPPRPSSVQPTHALEGGPVGGTSPPSQSPPTSPGLGPLNLIPPTDYRPLALSHFQFASLQSSLLLWGSHPLRLSTKVEFVAFLYDCLGERDESRKLARETIAEVYNAREGMDDEMFEDAAGLVGVLGTMMKKGLVRGEVGEGGEGSGVGVGVGAEGRTPRRRRGRVSEDLGMGNVI